jgi:hypothetical protein
MVDKSKKILRFTFLIITLFLLFPLSAQNSGKNYTKEIISLDSGDFTDLDFLVDLLKNKKYVFIGESSHETAEQYILKTRLVKFLHQQLGFNVLAFEHQLGTTTYFNEIKNSNIPDSKRVESLYHFHPKELTKLINYIQATDLKTTGFDFFMENPKYWYPALKNKFEISDTLLISDLIFYNLISKPKSQIDTAVFNRLKRELPLLWRDAALNVEKTILGNSIKKCLQKSMLIRAENIEKMGNWSTTL